MYTNTTAPNFILCTPQDCMEMLVEGYDYMLAFSTDTLLVIDKAKMQPLEWIIEGQDDQGYVLQASDEDEFLDTIIAIKQAINTGGNPLHLFNLGV